MTEWRCFFCDEVFTDKKLAAEHFGMGNYEGDTPICIEAATTERMDLVKTNREIWVEFLKERDALERAEYERDCWAQAVRMYLKNPTASWHDLGRNND